MLSTIGVILFLIYWVILLAAARHSGSAKYEDDGYGHSVLVEPAPVFSRRERTSINLVWFFAMMLCLLLLSLYEKEINSFSIPALKIFSEVAIMGFAYCLSVFCFGIFLALAWMLAIFLVMTVVFITIPARILQLLGFLFANGRLVRSETIPEK